MAGAIAGDGRGVDGLPLATLGHARRRASAVGDIQGQRLRQRRCRSGPDARTSGAPRTSRPPPRSATNREVSASCSRVKNSASTLPNTIASYWKSASGVGDSRWTGAAARLSPACTKNVGCPSSFCPLRTTASTSSPRSRGECPLEERVLEAGRAFDDQDLPSSDLRRDEDAAAVVIAGELVPAPDELDGVDRWLVRGGRHGKHLVHGRAVGGRRDPAHLDRPPVGAQRGRRSVRCRSRG